MAKYFAAGGVLGVAGWQVYVYQETRPKQLKRNPQGSYFFRGSLDDRNMDMLDSGDILLFRRKWWLQAPWGALTTLLRQQISGCQYDHVALVVLDKKGTPHVLEATYSGVKLRPYDERILQSNAEEIVVRQLRIPRTPMLRDKLLGWSETAVSLPYPYTLSELNAPLLPDKARTVAGAVSREAHPAAGLVMRGLLSMGIVGNTHRPPNLAMSKDFMPRGFLETVDGVRMKPIKGLRQSIAMLVTIVMRLLDTLSPLLSFFHGFVMSMDR